MTTWEWKNDEEVETEDQDDSKTTKISDCENSISSKKMLGNNKGDITTQIQRFKFSVQKRIFQKL